MKTINLLHLAALISFTSAIDIAPRSPNPLVVSIDIQKDHISDLVARERRLFRRQKVVNSVLDNEQSLYFANVTLGTPPQNLRFQVDTGSSDLWVNSANSSLCTRGRCIGSTFDPTASSTLNVVNNAFNISYVDGSGARGSYVTDTLGFGGDSITNFQFGIGLTSTSRQGVLGIGYRANEVQVINGKGSPYPNLPQALVDAGRINRNAYSLWLNDLDASTGTILFGGVNKAKYTGNLETVPVYRTRSGGYSQVIIAMTGFAYNGSGITSRNLPAPVILDSGSTITRLPDDIVELIYTSLNITYDSDDEVGYAPCELANTKAYFEFSFSGINIQVPFNELFLNAGTDATGQPLTFRNGKQACLFGIAPSLGIIPILGDTFLRSAYVVYDLERNEVSIAQTVYNSTTDDIREIASGTTAPVPGATPVPTTITSLAIGTATGGARIGQLTGSYTVLPTALNASPSGTAGTISSAGQSGSASTSTSAAKASATNGANPTKIPYVIGAVMMAGAGFVF